MNIYNKSNTSKYYSEYPKQPNNMGKSKVLKDPLGIPLGPKIQSNQEATMNLFPVDEAFFKGTIFRGLYKPYKNYQPRKEIPTSGMEKLQFDVDKYYFALHELRMYLDAYPTDQEAIDIFSQFQKEYIKAKNAYETRYGALDIEAPNLNTSPWNWTMGKWPWEREK